jgi:hypothetical protein
VVDRIAWANGSTVDGPAPKTFDYTNHQSVAAHLTLTDIQAALGGNQLLSAAATAADGVRSFDPRWNTTGSALIWVVRSVAPATSNTQGIDPTRAVSVSLLDDATGEVVDSQPLLLPADYNPARLWVTETRQNVDWNAEQSIAAFYRVQDAGGDAIQDGPVGGGSRGTNRVIVNGPDLPLILGPGSYTVTAWLGPREGFSGGSPTPTSPIGECSTQETLNAGDDVLLDAVYQEHAACTWSNQERPSFGFP